MIKIFLQHAASFDFAFLAKNSSPIGKSFYVDVTFEGKVNDEGMLIDFSLAKKVIKSVLKNFDHRLLVHKLHVKHKTPSYIFVHSQNVAKKKFFAMKSNKTWVKVLPSKILESLETNKNELENFIASEVLAHMPKNILNVSIQLQEAKQDLHDNDGCFFHYTHSLCHHKGQCQRFHGHSARVLAFKNKVPNNELSRHVAKELEGLYLVSNRYLNTRFHSPNFESIKKYCFKKNQFEKIKTFLHAIEYKSSHGRVSLFISKNLTLLLPYESTIENITQYAHEAILQEEDSEIYIYEGLSKGAIAK